jgi:hypothetical protein
MGTGGVTVCRGVHARLGATMPQIAGPTATTRSGPVVGVLHPADDAHRRDVSQFSGLPFAAPISGSARFLAPQRETSWSEPRDATSFGDIVPQITSALSTMMGAQAPITGDDCLNLNVWTPSAAPTSPEPVPPLGTTGADSPPITTWSSSRSTIASARSAIST